MNESPIEIRRRALAWSNDAGEYTPASTLLERIVSFLSDPAPTRSDLRPRDLVTTGVIRDTSQRTLADYTLYRKTHFSNKVKCTPDCPYCNRTRRQMEDHRDTKALVAGIENWAGEILSMDSL